MLSLNEENTSLNTVFLSMVQQQECFSERLPDLETLEIKVEQLDGKLEVQTPLTTSASPAHSGFATPSQSQEQETEK